MSRSPDQAFGTRAAPACPICGRPAVAAETPFCSPRCRDRDLLQWLGDGYALPGAAADNALDSADGED